MKKENLKEIPKVKLELAANQNVRERDFWLHQLSGDLVKSNFPFDYQKNDIHERNINKVSFSFPKETCSRLLRMSRGSDYALNAILLSGLSVLLNKHTHNTDIIIGAPIYKVNRYHSGDNDTGLINTLLPIRTGVQDHLSFKQLIIQVSRTIRQAIDHYNYPLEILVKKLDLQVSEGHFPFFDIVLLLRNIHDKSDIRHISPLIIFDFARKEKSIQGLVEFDTLLYDSSTIERMIGHLVHLFEEVLAHMDLPIAQIDIVTEKEKKQLLKDFNRTAAGYPCDKTIVELFKEQVETVPAGIALVFENKHYSYQEIDKQSNRVAHVLKTKGVQPDTIVGIMAERSIGGIIGFLGIIKAGGAYLPIDPGYTEERIKYLLEDSKVKTLVKENKNPGDLSIEKDIDIVFNDEVSVFFSSKLTLSSTPVTSLAYVMYTSGTTGQPKGVMVEHRSVVRLVKNTNYIDFTRVGRMLQTGALEFDASTFEIWGALLNGLILYVLSKEKILLTRVLGEAIEKYDIGTMWLTAPWFNRVVDADITVFHGLRYLLVGGDILSVVHINRVRQRYPGLNIINGYGPTENTTFSTTFLIDREYTGSIPIGSPISASTVYILDKNRKLVPLGVTGELVVGGVGLSRGYLNQPQLTAGKFDYDFRDYRLIGNYKLQNTMPLSIKKAGDETSTNHKLQITKKTAHELHQLPQIGATSNEKFLQGGPGGTVFSKRVPPGRRRHPSARGPYRRIYKTGDLGRWLADGTIEFLGRIDDQVKICGIRIEPGEVEYLLLKHEKVKEAVVIVREDEGREKYLCAYIVPAAPGAPAPGEAFTTASLAEELKTYLSLKTADFMIPRYFVPVEKIPLNSNGKVDRRVLPVPAAGAGKVITPPQTLLQQKLVEIWADVLMIKKETIGIESDFFQLGGHSLKAAVLVSRIHKLLHVEVPLGEIFKTPTIKELSALITSAEKIPYMPLLSVEAKEYYRLSSTQKRLYLLQRMELASTGYNVPMVLSLEGRLDGKRLENTIHQIVKRHESLRTSFALAEEEPVQRIHDDVKFEIEYFGTRQLHEKGTRGLAPLSEESHPSSSYVIRRLSSDFIRPFDLSRAPLLRVGLIQEQEQKHILMLDMHHIVTDGTSMDLFVKESLALYAGEELPPLKFQYKDYSRWQNSPQQKKAIKKQEEYWLKQFAGEVPVLNLPLDYPRPKVQSFEGAALSFEVPGELTRSINQMALHSGATLYMVLLAIYNIFLSKISGQEDIVVGTPIAARRHADLERIIGMFVNTLAMRNYPQASKRIIDFLMELKQRTLQAFENQEYQFEYLVERVAVNRDISRNPLFDTMFALQNMAVQANEIPMKDIPQLRIRPYETEYRTAKFDLNLTCFQAGEKLLCSIEYYTKLFKKETIERFITYFKQILSAVLKDSNKKISQIEIITAEEKRQILYDFNDTRVVYPKDKTLHQLIAEQVKRTPDNTALVGSKLQITNHKSQTKYKLHNTNDNQNGVMHLTYKELNRLANQLAHFLIEKDVKPDTIVGMMLERSQEMIIGILGILKAGGAYLPIDPAYPAERIQYMLQASRAKLLIAQQNNIAMNLEVCEIIEPRTAGMGQMGNEDVRSLQHTGQQGKLIYLIFTSGSTGKPKGAGIYHRGFLNLVNWFLKEFKINPGDRNLLITSPSFDLTQKNIFAPLLTGGSLHIPYFDYYDPGVVLREIEKKQITLLNCTPGMYYQLMESGAVDELRKLSSLRYVFLGGEPISAVKLVKFGQSHYFDAEIVNTYGPTECTDVCAYYRIKEPREFLEANVPIGKPIYNTKLYVLDDNLRPLPVGIPGELAIGGDGVGKGYINDEQLTKKKFVQIFPGLDINMLVYRSGDLVKWLPDGNIEFLGRIDHQVKIRGFRIELGEIESQLLDYDGIKEAVVVVKVDEKEDKFLCAYIVSNIDITSEELRVFLFGRLPNYMIPTYFVFLESIPLTPNGKVDRKMLPEPGMEMGQSYIAPGNKIEKKLAAIWSELLSLEKEKISIDANFFQLGGHSLRAITMLAKIHKQLDVRVPLAKIFQSPTIQAVAQYIGNSEVDKFIPMEPVEKKEYYVLSSAQRRLYILQQMDVNRIVYNMPMIFQLDMEIPGVKMNKEKLEQTINRLIQHHEGFRTYFKVIDMQIFQGIREPHELNFQIKYYNLKDGGVGEKSLPGMIENILKEFVRPFDLTQAPLVRVGLVITREERYILLVDMHHIISDIVSQFILERDFITLLKGEELQPLCLQYKEYAEWLKNSEIMENLNRQEKYWLDEYKGKIPLLRFPVDYKRKKELQFEGDSVSFFIDRTLSSKVRTQAQQLHVTVMMYLFSIYIILIARYSGQEELVVGTVAAGRQHADLENIIGFFVNMLPIKTSPHLDKSFSQYLLAVKEKTVHAYENQGYPFEELISKLDIPREPGRHPLVDVVFAFQNQAESPAAPRENSPGIPDFKNFSSARFDLMLQASEGPDAIYMLLQYPIALFKRSTIEEFTNFYLEILSQTVENPGIKLKEINVNLHLTASSSTVIQDNKDDWGL